MNINEYIIGNYYKIKPFGDENYDKTIQQSIFFDGYEAEFIGFLRLENKNKLPVFKFKFYKYGDPTCFVILENGKWIAGGQTLEESIEEFKSKINFYGNYHDFIKVKNKNIKKKDFITQINNTTLNKKPEIINEFLLKGSYSTIHGDFGEVKFCPKCDVIRDTTCCACGCGSCKKCDYRWVCNPTPLNNLDKILSPLIKINS